MKIGKGRYGKLENWGIYTGEKLLLLPPPILLLAGRGGGKEGRSKL
jgi:hypothetical protein